MDRNEALEVVKEHIKSPNLVSHMLATEAVMRALARRFGEDEDRWGLAGLLHDADAEMAELEEQGLLVPKLAEKPAGPSGKHADMPAQGLLVPKLARDGLDPEVAAAIASHNPYTGRKPQGRMGWALYAGDPLTGLIVASALVLPDKKLSELTAQSVLKRFAEARFAKGANREQIAKCSELGLTLEEFVGIGLAAMKGIASDIGM
ncbi:MAG: phosphohydrolase [Chloroflexi bacterium]|nr:phosphohydrolase [Chloroflexota bacterium]